jgi:hypothetical protein
MAATQPGHDEHMGQSNRSSRSHSLLMPASAIGLLHFTLSVRMNRLKK